MDHLDRAVRQSLSAEDAQLLDHIAADDAFHRQVLATFAGRLRWFNALGWAAGFVLFGVASMMAWRFVYAPDLADMLRWGAASALAFAGVALVKVWFWLELQKNTVVRELKKLELQVASLAEQIRRP